MTPITFGTFWSGTASPYQTLCLASWVAHGFDVTVYTAEADLALPQGARRRPVEEVLDLGGHIHRYKKGFGAGSPSLHSNLFRYKLLERGEWWLDTDVVALTDTLPATDFFLARQANNKIGTAVMRLPAQSPLLRDAISEAEAKIGHATWSQLGPQLVTRLVAKHDLGQKVADRRTAYAIDYTETIKFFDPEARAEVEERVASSTFVHLWNAIWDGIGFPQTLGPPEGSYLDALVKKYLGAGAFPAQVPAASVRKWWANRERGIALQSKLDHARQ